MRRASWIRAALAVALALAAGPAEAGPPRAQRGKAGRGKAAKRGDGPDLAKIGDLVQEGQTRFETADYPGAIDLWTQAYSGLPAESAYAVQRGLLVYQIAQAYVEAYSLDPDLIYLRKAERLFTTYLETLREADVETTAEVRATIAELQRTIEATVAAAEEEEAAAAATAPPATPEAEAPAPAPVDAPPAPDPRAGRGLRIAGGVLIGLGGAGLGLMTYSLAWGARIDARGEAAVAAGEPDPEVFRELLRDGTLANKMALGSGIAAGAAVALRF